MCFPYIYISHTLEYLIMCDLTQFALNYIISMWAELLLVLVYVEPNIIHVKI